MVNRTQDCGKKTGANGALGFDPRLSSVSRYCSTTLECLLTTLSREIYGRDTTALKFYNYDANKLSSLPRLELLSLCRRLGKDEEKERPSYSLLCSEPNTHVREDKRRPF